MQFIRDNGNAQYLIRAYEPGRVRINDDFHDRSLIISPVELILDWPPRSLDELTEADIERLLDTGMEVFILGTGEQHRFPPMDLMRIAHARGRTLEIMDTHAACRTYAVLAAEGRKVAAALLLG